jgi:hypothetical protein
MTMKIPRSIAKSRDVTEFAPHEYVLFIPDDESMGIAKGFYVNLHDICVLLRANKNSQRLFNSLRT